MTRSLALSKHRSPVTFVKQCKKEIENRYRAKSKLNCNTVSEPETAKNAIFLEESLEEETTNLILVVDAERKPIEHR